MFLPILNQNCVQMKGIKRSKFYNYSLKKLLVYAFSIIGKVTEVCYIQEFLKVFELGHVREISEFYE